MHGENIPFGYGFWSLVVVNAAIFILFALSFLTPVRRREWRSFGVFTAFVVALFTEMYGFPLTIYILTAVLGSRYPALNPFSHASGHLWITLLGGGAWMSAVIHLISNGLMLGGLLLMGAGWRRIHRAKGALVTDGVYAWVRHPQYTGLFLITVGMLVQWPTIITVATWPVLLVVYYRLARHEERGAEISFGEAYWRYKAAVPMFIPRIGLRRPAVAAVFVGTLASAEVASAEPLAYVALANARKVAVVDVGAGQVVRTFPLTVSPHGIAASRDGRWLFVPDLLIEKVVRVLDAATGREAGRIAVEAPVHHLTLTPGGGRLYATLTSAGRLAIVDLDTWRVRSVEVGGSPDFAVPAPDGGVVYVSDLASNTLAVVNPATAQVEARVTVGDGTGHGAVTSDGTRGFFTAAGKGAVSVVDLRLGQQTVSVLTGPDPHGVAIGHGGSRLFVSNRGDGTVTVIDLATLEIERKIKVAEGPEHLTASPDGRLILVAVPSDNLLAVIDAERLEVIRRILVNGDPHQVAF